MKKIFLYTSFLAAAFSLTAIQGCKKVLEENPRSVLTPDYFKTAQGINAGLVAAYSGLRYQYGPEGAMTLTVPGTDEFTIGSLANTDEVAFNAYSPILNPTNSQLLTPWNNNFTFINTCNGVIEYGAEATDLDEATKAPLLAEAKFLRAMYYFQLVQSFGGVPLNLGAGDLKFNTNPSTESVRSSVGDVYAAMITDLKDAIAALPAKPSQPGRASAASAIHLLAKVYLFKATLPAAKETDDYTNALLYANMLIDNQGTYGVALMTNFGDVNKPGNEHGTESLFTVEHTLTAQFNEFSTANGGVLQGLKENRANYFFTAYEGLQNPAGKTLVNRSILYQRAWVRFQPTTWLLDTCFADKDNDSRFDNSFRTLWLCNNAGQGVDVGDTGIYLPRVAVDSATIAASRYIIVNPSTYAKSGAKVYPNLTKFADPNRLANNDPSSRPTIIFKLSETYLIAAEAAYYATGAASAVPYLNVVRERAAYRPVNTGAQNDAAKVAMDITTSDVDIDFILDERSRELCGEQQRWNDLVRTGLLVKRVKAHNAEGAAGVTATFAIRPIPQTQINLTSGTPFPQNTAPDYPQQ